MDFSKKTLPNGVRVIIAPMSNAESVTVMVLVKAGSRYEPKEISGLSHFLEHMAFKGTKSRPTALQIATEVEGMGGEFNAFTSHEITAYHIKCQSRFGPKAAEILLDMLKNSLLAEEELNKEKGVIIEEINMYRDIPPRQIYDDYHFLCYGDTNLGRPILGSIENIKQMKQQQMLSYINKLYQSHCLSVIIAGGITPETEKTIARFSLINKGNGYESEGFKNIQTKPQIFFHQKKTEQTHFRLGWKTPGYLDSDREIYGVLSAILGQGMGSRLWHEVRERRGLAYYVSCGQDTFREIGDLTIRAGVNPTKTEEAIKVTLNVVREILSEVKLADLDRAKEYTIGTTVLEMEDGRNIALHLGTTELLENGARDIAEDIAKIRVVTVADIQRAARQIIQPKNLNLAVIGQYKNEDKLLRILHTP